MKKFFLSALTSAVLLGSSAFAMEEKSNPGVAVAQKSASPDLLERAKEYADKGQYEQAFKIYEDLVRTSPSEDDVSIAYNNLGNYHFYGKGVPEDRKKAMSFYEESAKRGNMIGQYNWALHCFNGFYVDQAPIQALYYFDQAAKQGDEVSADSIGKILANYEEQADGGDLAAKILLAEVLPAYEKKYFVKPAKRSEK